MISRPETTLRRERGLVALLATLCASIAIYGYLTIPSEADLIRTASSAEDPQDRVRAMNAMIRRGLWEDRAFKEFELFMKGSPKEVPQFIADMHGDMLKPDRRAWSR